MCSPLTKATSVRGRRSPVAGLVRLPHLSRPRSARVRPMRRSHDARRTRRARLRTAKARSSAFARLPLQVIGLPAWLGRPHLIPPRFDSQCAKPREKPSLRRSTHVGTRTSVTARCSTRSMTLAYEELRRLAFDREQRRSRVHAQSDGARERGMAQAGRVAIVRVDIANALQAHRCARHAAGARRDGAPQNGGEARRRSTVVTFDDALHRASAVPASCWRSTSRWRSSHASIRDRRSWSSAASSGTRCSRDRRRC